MKTIFLYVIFTTMLVMKPLHAKDIIFDLDGVLIKTGTSLVIREFGVHNIANYFFHFKAIHEDISIKFKQKFFQILDYSSTLHMPDAMDDYPVAFDEYGQRLPYFMCAWMDGSLSGEEIIAMVIESISQHPEWFEHSSEEILIQKLTRMLFSPERFVKTRKISHKGIRFIKSLKRNGHRVYVLSNWDRDSFRLLVEQNPKLFGLFDGIIISGDIGALKPSEEAYKTALATHKLDPENCIFIDDQIENMIAADMLNITTIKARHKRLSNNTDFRFITKNMKKIQRAEKQP